MAWETKGARSVKNDIKIKDKFNFKQSAKDLLITSQLRSALIFNKKTKAVNYNIDTYKKKIYVYGIAATNEERDEVIKEAKQILDVEDVIVSILLVDDLADTGRTLRKCVKWLEHYHGFFIEELKTATLWTKGLSTFTPDYYVEFLPNDPWIHQPFEKYETMLVEELRE